MSGHGAPTTDATTLDATGLRVAVVAASWHTTIMDGLLRGARRALADQQRRRAELLCAARRRHRLGPAGRDRRQAGAARPGGGRTRG